MGLVPSFGVVPSSGDVFLEASGLGLDRGVTTRENPQHHVVTVIGSLVFITSMKASSLCFPIALTASFIRAETTTRPARARYRPRMHGFPCQDRKGTPRRSAGYQKPKRAILLCLSARHKHKERYCARKRKSHRETKRASHGKWRCMRVRNESNFGARWFMEGEASLEAS